MVYIWVLSSDRWARDRIFVFIFIYLHFTILYIKINIHFLIFLLLVIEKILFTVATFKLLMGFDLMQLLYYFFNSVQELCILISIF